jgi:Uma2 family endonuclease
VRFADFRDKLASKRPARSVQEASEVQAQPERFLAPAEYLNWERLQETPQEHVNGEVFAMTGASREHNLLCMDLGAALHAQLRGKPCEVCVNAMRVKVEETGIYTYPDIVAVCREPRLEDHCVDTMLNPVLIVEVLSESR